MDLRRAGLRRTRFAAALAAALAVAPAFAASPEGSPGEPCASSAATTGAANCVAMMRERVAAQRLRDDRAQRDAVAPNTSLADALMARHEFDLEPGDVILLRSDELVSSAISQIGEHPAFFSHAALIGLDPGWDEREVIEAGVGQGLHIEELDDWLERGFVRVAVYRPRDPALARRAAIAAHEDATSRPDPERAYDYAFDLDHHDRLYCTEVVTQAYARAAPAAARVPLHLSFIGNLVDTFPLNALGVRETQVFLPDDLELDPRFRRVLELRVPSQLDETAALDRELRKLFDGLRGPHRANLLASIDALRPSSPIAMPVMLRGSYSAFRTLPASVQSRLIGLSRLVARDLKAADANN